MHARRTYSRRAALGMGGMTGWFLLSAGYSNTCWAANAPQSRPTMPAELQSELPDAQTLGSATMKFLGAAIYEARLWVQAGFQASNYANSPFALELNYFRALRGPLIAEQSLKEMRRQGPLGDEQEQAWLQAMVRSFPDVKAGDRITGLHKPGAGARFWFNGQSRPALNDPDFSRTFFGIWLSDATSEPRMRSQLLGRGAA